MKKFCTLLWCFRKFNFKLSKLLNQKAIHKPSAQHVLDDDYYKRIKFNLVCHMMMEKIDDINDADVVLLGVSRTTKPHQSI